MLNPMLHKDPECKDHIKNPISDSSKNLHLHNESIINKLCSLLAMYPMNSPHPATTPVMM